MNSPLSAVPNQMEARNRPPVPPTDDLRDEIRDLENQVDHIREEIDTGGQHPPTDDLKTEIRDLANQVDHVREELEERD